MTWPFKARPPWWRIISRWRWDRARARLLALQAASEQLPQDIVARITAAVDARSAELGLVVAGFGSALTVTELRLWDRCLPMQFEWCDVPADETTILAKARQLVDGIIAKHGPGSIWTFPLIGAVHPVFNDGQLVVPLNGRPHVRLRAVYFHENCRLPEPPPEVLS